VPSCGGFHPFQALRKFETVVFKGCAVKFEFDLATGEVGGALLPLAPLATDVAPAVVDSRPRRGSAVSDGDAAAIGYSRRAETGTTCQG
jgi:hypothetical protein